VSHWGGASPGQLTPPRTTVRCLVDAAPDDPACAGQTIPASITKKLDLAASQAELAPSQTAKKAKRLAKSAKRLLKKASALATKAAHRRHPTLTADCAAALVDATHAASAAVGP
jgi:hypothetical protein